MGDEVLRNLDAAISRCDIEAALRVTSEALRLGVDPLLLLSTLTETIRSVGESFEREAIWLPELIGSATALQKCLPLVEEAIRSRGLKSMSVGTAVIGTVRGDIHNIGKSMVATLLVAEGFSVHDLGVDINAQQFIAAIHTYRPDVLAMSALLTTTSVEMRAVIAEMAKEGLRDRIKVIVGGAPITAEFAAEIGADGYSPTAPGGARLARTLVEGGGKGKQP